MSTFAKLTLRSNSCETRTCPAPPLRLSRKDSPPCGTAALGRGRRHRRQCSRSSKCGCPLAWTAPMDEESTGYHCLQLRSRCSYPCRCTDRLWHFHSRPHPGSAAPFGSRHHCIWKMEGINLPVFQKKLTCRCPRLDPSTI